jgi:transcriptional regulator with XRE-family HTH domain
LDAVWLGQRIRQARERRQMSQEDLAVAISKDQRAIYEYEIGKRKLAVIDLPLIATVLEVPLMYFFEEDISLQDLDAALLNHFHVLPNPETRQAAIDILRIYSESILRSQKT